MRHVVRAFTRVCAGYGALSAFTPSNQVKNSADSSSAIQLVPKRASELAMLRTPESVHQAEDTGCPELQIFSPTKGN
jgi:hypothetical protein